MSAPLPQVRPLMQPAEVQVNADGQVGDACVQALLWKRPELKAIAASLAR